MRYLKPFNEAVGLHQFTNFAQDLKDFCEMNLAYLMDEELDISILPVKSGLGLSFKLTLELNDNPRLWNDIKDHMIPFLIRLSNQYEIKRYPRIDKKDVKIEVTRDLEAARQNRPQRTTNVFYQIDKLINDDTKSGIFYDRQIRSDYSFSDENTGDVLGSYIKEFEFVIDESKKEPKKGVLSKIKSFFK
jgi:hypothetical protein